MINRPSSFVPRPKLITLFIIALIYFFSFDINSLYAQSSLFQQDYQAYASSKHASSNWNSLVKSGMEAYHEGNFDVAQKSLYKAFNAGCESPIVIFMLALLNEHKMAYYSALDYYKMAKKGFRKANKNHRFSKSFDENYGRALFYSGKQDEALPILKRAAKRTKSFWLLKLLGMLSFAQGDTLNAVSYFERAVRVKDSSVTKAELIFIYGLLAKLFLHKGEQAGAIRYYQKVLELDPNNAEARKYKSTIEKQYQQKKMLDMMDGMTNM